MAFLYQQVQNTKMDFSFLVANFQTNLFQMNCGSSMQLLQLGNSWAKILQYQGMLAILLYAGMSLFMLLEVKFLGFQDLVNFVFSGWLDLEKL